MELLKYGSVGAAVRKVQEFLTVEGKLFPGKFMPDVYDWATASAVWWWQAERADLKADGVVGPITWAAMFPATADTRAVDPQGKLSFASAVVVTAAKYLGIREDTPNRGPLIDVWQRRAGLNPADRSPWCAVFVANVCAEAAESLGKEPPIPLGAGSVVDQHCRSLYLWAKDKGWTRPSNEAQPGDIFVMLFSGTSSGHTGFVESYRNGIAKTIEGNTNMAGSREGDGVYSKDRPYSQFVAVIRPKVV